MLQIRRRELAKEILASQLTILAFILNTQIVSNFHNSKVWPVQTDTQ